MTWTLAADIQLCWDVLDGHVDPRDVPRRPMALPPGQLLDIDEFAAHLHAHPGVPTVTIRDLYPHGTVGQAAHRLRTLAEIHQRRTPLRYAHGPDTDTTEPNEDLPAHPTTDAPPPDTTTPTDTPTPRPGRTPDNTPPGADA